MSKFKIGDRVRLLSDAVKFGSVSGQAPERGQKGEVGTIEHRNEWGWWVKGVGRWDGGTFTEEQLEHADPQPPVAHHDRVVADTHAAIDRLVAHLERQATEHVHALDALRAENEALRTQNAHLRALQAAHGAKPVREVVRGLIDGYANMSEPGSDANRYAVDQGVRQATEYWHRKWMMHDVDGSDVGEGDYAEAIAWVLDGVLPKR